MTHRGVGQQHRAAVAEIKRRNAEQPPCNLCAPNLKQAGKRLMQARKAERDAYAAAEVAALDAIADGVPEAAIAKALNVDRMTVRKWAGKR